MELLEFRLKELGDIVDYFVVVESTRSFAGTPKNLYYLMNNDRYVDYHDKIIHVIVDDMPSEYESSLELESYQRNAIDRGLRSIVDWHCEDIIIISDIDEIPNQSVLQHLKYDVNNAIPIYTNPHCSYLNSPIIEHPLRLSLDVYYYSLNCKVNQVLDNPIVLNYFMYSKLVYDGAYIHHCSSTSPERSCDIAYREHKGISSYTSVV